LAFNRQLSIIYVEIKEVKEFRYRQLAIVVGGGNIWRGQVGSEMVNGKSSSRLYGDG